MLDYRGDNGIRKVPCGSPDEHGFDRTTWTLELVKLVIAQALYAA